MYINNIMNNKLSGKNQETIIISFVILFFLTIAFTSILYLIKVVYNTDYKDKKEEEAYKKLSRFLVPLISILCFFVSTYFVALIIQEGMDADAYQFTGIYFMFFIGLILTIFNNTILKEDNIKKYIKGKKFTISGLFMALGVGAIVFGFLDNFGLKLGTEALDTAFLNVFLSPFSVDTRFIEHKKSISENITYMNNWVNGKWRSVINQLLRFKDDINSLQGKNPDIRDLIDDINEFIESDDARPLYIPDKVRQANMTNEYVQNIKEKFDMIDGSKAMMGNTFSDFIGAVLGAAIVNLFVYMTSYDGIYTGDDSIDESFFVKYLNAYMPFMEALFIALGCLIPVFINIGMTRQSYNNNNTYAWLVVFVITIIVVIMMYLSVRGIRNFTTKEKRKSLKKTLVDIKDRLDINENDVVLNEKLNKFIDELN